ncbi:MAG TPA: alpha/beta fold hydrolase [Polyangiaceae bacterium]|nr:alpha/beta fold hydrolase [Polyangiaceae bacterium]
MAARLRRRTLLVGAGVAAAVAADLAFELAGAGVLVYAPNAGRAVEGEPDPLPPGVEGRALRVAVGPPRASLALWVLGPPAARGTVFLLHGIRDRKRSMLGWGGRLAAHGYRAVLVDHRGQGASSGDYLTYGVLEARDLAQALDALRAEGLAAGRVGALGVSYGAATAIEWAGRDARVDAVVAVAPFASLRAVVPSYVALFAPGVGRLVPDALLGRAIARGGSIAGFDPDAASPLDAIGRTRAPVLLVHGRDDRHIPPSHSEALRARAAGPAELALLDGEDHASIGADRSGRLWAQAQAWLDRWVGGG